MTTKNTNLNIWNSVKQTPTNFLKKIEFGYLKGKSDINPQWRLMAMTQAFGPVGHGWTYRIVRTWSEPCQDGNVMAFAEVAVKTKIDSSWGEEFFGIGGSTIVEKNKHGISANDEGYKKAVTDALGVAFKAVGVAADVYLGNFDGSKYLYNYDQAYQEDSQKVNNPNQQQPSKPKRSQDQLYQDALKAIKDTTDPEVLNKALSRFTGTVYETGISNACRARADLMGWAPITTSNSSVLHH